MTDMDTGAVRWLHKIARQNYWRVEKFFELDDLVQEGYYCYYYVRKRYPDAKDAAHIMQLFKLTYMCHIHDLAKGACASGTGWRPQLETAAWLSSACGPEDAAQRERLSGSDADAEMLAFVADAPPTLSRLLRILLAGDGLRGELRQRTSGRRESLNERFCSLIGVNPRDFDLHEALLNYLHGRA
jgi:hypothetical protein